MTDSTASTKPYLIRAIRDWAQDGGLTPHILVNVTMQGVKVPHGFVQDERIVLNVSDNATGNMEITHEWILFNARFGGVSHSIDVPIEAVIAIFARENGQGLSFETEFLMRAREDDSDIKTGSAASVFAQQKPQLVDNAQKGGKPMRLAKVELDNEDPDAGSGATVDADDVSSVPKTKGKIEGKTKGKIEGKTKGKRPHLKLVE